jgi:prophage regulatory protein
MTGLGKTTVYAMVKEGKFPQPIKIGMRFVAWPAHEIEAWIADLIAARDAGNKAGS